MACKLHSAAQTDGNATQEPAPDPAMLEATRASLATLVDFLLTTSINGLRGHRWPLLMNESEYLHNDYPALPETGAVVVVVYNDELHSFDQVNQFVRMSRVGRVAVTAVVCEVVALTPPRTRPPNPNPPAPPNRQPRPNPNPNPAPGFPRGIMQLMTLTMCTDVRAKAISEAIDAKACRAAQCTRTPHSHTAVLTPPRLAIFGFSRAAPWSGKGTIAATPPTTFSEGFETPSCAAPSRRARRRSARTWPWCVPDPSHARPAVAVLS